MDAGGCAELGDELFLRITFIAKVPAGSESQFSRFGQKRVASSRCSRLGSTMFGLLQLPFADLRCLADDRFGRVPRPDWDVDNPGESFVRGFGKMSSRNATGYGLMGERGYVEFDHAVAFPTPVRHKQEGWPEAIPLLLWFRRMYFDGGIAGRFEYGFMADPKIEQAFFEAHPELRYDLAEVGRTINDAQVEVRSPDESRTETRLDKCGRALGRAYLAATTTKEGLKRYPPAELEGRFLVLGPSTIHLRVPVALPVLETDDRRPILETGDDCLFITSAAGCARRNTVVVQISPTTSRREPGDERARRVLFSHLNAMLFAHSTLVSVADDKEITRHRLRLRDLTEKMLKRFEHLKPASENPYEAEFARALAAFSLAHAGRVDELTERLQSLADQAAEQSRAGKVFSWGRSLFEQIMIKSAEAIAAGATSLR